LSAFTEYEIYIGGTQILSVTSFSFLNSNWIVLLGPLEPLKTEAIRFFETSGNILLTTHLHIPEDLKAEDNYSEYSECITGES
jgi:hypothetical protein